MTTIDLVRQRHIKLMEKSCVTLGHLIRNLSLEEATTWRDSGDGWTVTEVMCHLRDFDLFFLHRARMMVAEAHPVLPGYDHEALAIEGKYNEQNLFEVYASLQTSRAEAVAFFRGLMAEQWERTGVHPERDSFDMTDAVMQFGLHDNDHMEQIARIIAEKLV